ncbi:hypothetical protein LUZ60_016154 [Juncus effusus]|nr:hypothetical protein LUZ60_016154 [Juncus effusus]
MDQWRNEDDYLRPPDSATLSDPRKAQKAGREKMRRDRLNEHFQELGNAIDPERPKNDKATILSDTIHVLKELTSQVNKLKSEFNSLSEESRELSQEKSELRDEKLTLKSEIEALNAEYQQRLRMLSPVMMSPYRFPVPVPVPVPSSSVPVQPYPFFQPYLPFPQPVGQTGRNDPLEGSRRKERSDECSDVATELELKIPGSKSSQDKDGKRKKGSGSGLSSVQESSCNSSTGEDSVANK